jgi:hypothetical protein
VFGCFGGQCAVACPTRADAAPDAVSVTNNDAGHLCGDGVVNGPEECDLGQQNNTAVYGDRVGCTRDCTSPHYCGDGILDPDFGEMCDYGTSNGPPPCTNNCIYWIM